MSKYIKFKRDARGAIAILFAALLMVIVGIVGVAIDFGNAHRIQSKLQAALDAATLVTTQSLAKGNKWQTAKKDGERYFAVNTEGLKDVDMTLTNIGSTSEDSVSGKASAYWPRSFTMIFDSSRRTVAAQSTSGAARQAVEVIFLADVSYSMGIGATQQDIAILSKKTGCAFACHKNGTDEKAKAFGARMRIDVIRDAYRASVQEIEKAKEPHDIVRLGMITFSNSVVDKIEPTEDLTAAANAARNIVFPRRMLQGGTNLHAAAQAALSMISERKKINTTPTQYVVIWLTDAVEDTAIYTQGLASAHDYSVPVTEPSIVVNSFATIMTFAPNLCTSLKDAGVNVMVMNTKYILEGYYTPEISSISSILLPIMTDRLENCASSKDYVRHAEEPADIIAATQELVRLAMPGALRVKN